MPPRSLRGSQAGSQADRVSDRRHAEEGSAADSIAWGRGTRLPQQGGLGVRKRSGLSESGAVSALQLQRGDCMNWVLSPGEGISREGTRGDSEASCRALGRGADDRLKRSQEERLASSSGGSSFKSVVRGGALKVAALGRVSQSRGEALNGAALGRVSRSKGEALNGVALGRVSQSRGESVSGGVAAGGDGGEGLQAESWSGWRSGSPGMLAQSQAKQDTLVQVCGCDCEGGDADGCQFEKGADWSLFVLVGVPEGGFREGGGGAGGSTPKSIRKKIKPSCIYIHIINYIKWIWPTLSKHQCRSRWVQGSIFKAHFRL